MDFNLYGQQIVAHLVPGRAAGAVAYNQVDGDAVPVPHFAVVLSMEEWQALAKRLEQAGLRSLTEPHSRFASQVGEQATMFLCDPSGNALEFKALADERWLFARERTCQRAGLSE